MQNEHFAQGKGVFMEQKILLSIEELKKMISKIKKERKELNKILKIKRKISEHTTGLFKIKSVGVNKYQNEIFDLIEVF